MRMAAAPIAACLTLLLSLGMSGVGGAAQSNGQVQQHDPVKLEMYCKNFTVGDKANKEFYSPLYPRKYPNVTTCFRTLKADRGYFVRIDFRDVFRIEPPTTAGDCHYDYLEIRDGEHGYSPLIGKYCGSDFPPIITSSGRFLWMRFHSDETIQYTGFKAVYTFIENPLEHAPDIGKCAFDVSGHQDFIGTDNITDARRKHALTFGTPVDCVWAIHAEKDHQISLSFPEGGWKLKHPNDCHLNYIQIFDGSTDSEHEKVKYCGSAVEATTCEFKHQQNTVCYVRFYGEQTGIYSNFTSVFTQIRGTVEGTVPCHNETEYDCEDATCISAGLRCNGVKNCKFGWDEESCGDIGSEFMKLFAKTHVVSILVVLTFIMVGMIAGMAWNFRRIIKEDQEELAASREKSLAASSLMEKATNGTSAPHDVAPSSAVPSIPTIAATSTPDAPVGLASAGTGAAASFPSGSSGGRTTSAASHGRHQSRGLKPASTSGLSDSNGGCYVPDVGLPLNSTTPSSI